MSTAIGEWAENEAVKILLEKGHKILERNWRAGKLEVDIISMDKNQLVFTEVKYRRSDYFGAPQEFVTRQKQRFLIKAANVYLENKDLDVDSRFDVIAISKNNKEHFEEAFRPY